MHFPGAGLKMSLWACTGDLPARLPALCPWGRRSLVSPLLLSGWLVAKPLVPWASQRPCSCLRRAGREMLPPRASLSSSSRRVAWGGSSLHRQSNTPAGSSKGGETGAVSLLLLLSWLQCALSLSEVTGRGEWFVSGFVLFICDLPGSRQSGISKRLQMEKCFRKALGTQWTVYRSPLWRLNIFASWLCCQNCKNGVLFPFFYPPCIFAYNAHLCWIWLQSAFAGQAGVEETAVWKQQVHEERAMTGSIRRASTKWTWMRTQDHPRTGKQGGLGHPHKAGRCSTGAKGQPCPFGAAARGEVGMP